LVATKGLILGFTIGTARTLTQLNDLSRNANVSVKKLQELGYIATLTGSNIEAVASSLSNLNRTIGEANLGIGRGAITFKKLGLSAKNQNGELKTTEQLLTEIGNKIRNISNSEKTAILSKLGIDPSLIGVLTSDVSELRKEFNQLYESVGIDSENPAKSSNEFIESLTRLKFVFDTLKNGIVLQFVPELREGIDSFRKLMVENSKKIIQAISPILKSLLNLTQAFFILTRRIAQGAVKLIDIFKSINSATHGWAGYILGAVTAWKLLNVAFSLSPIGRLITLGIALALLVDDFLGFQEVSRIEMGNKEHQLGVATTFLCSFPLFITWIVLFFGLVSCRLTQSE